MKRKLLIVLPWSPFPLTDGGRQGSFNMIKKLQFDFEIHLCYSLYHKSQLLDEKKMQLLLPEVVLHPYYQYDEKRFEKTHYYLFRVNRFVISRIFKLIYFDKYIFSDDYLSHISQIIANEEIEIVQNEYTELIDLIYILDKTTKNIFVHHEIKFQTLSRNGVQKNIFDKFMVNKSKSEEINSLNKYDAILTVSDVDKFILESEGVSVPVYSSPTFVDGLNSLPTNKSFDRKVVTFIGGYSHYPNREGISWFIEKVWNSVLLKDSAFELHIIGNWPKNFANSIISTNKSVKFLGFVDDLATALQGTIMIVPINIGSGIRMKILEAVQLKIPFITTTVGVEGLDFSNGSECIICDDSDKFAESVVSLYHNPSLRATLTENAYKVFNTKYSPEILAERRGVIYNTVSKNENSRLKGNDSTLSDSNSSL